MPATPPGALLFDVFGTLVDWRSAIARALERALGRPGAPVDGAALALGWRALYQPAMEEIRAGRRPFVPLDRLHEENLARLLAERGLPALPAGAHAALARAWHALDPWPDAAPGLARLRRGRIVAALSNGNLALMVDLSRHAGLQWDAILGAEWARAYKPDPAVYLGAAAALGLAPGECMMVAAHNDDLAAARNLGLQTAFVPRPLEYGPDQRGDLLPAQDWDICAPDLLALAARLERAQG